MGSLILDPRPDYDRGQVLVLAGTARIIDGRALYDARRLRLPIHSRHGIKCRNFWNRKDLT